MCVCNIVKSDNDINKVTIIITRTFMYIMFAYRVIISVYIMCVYKSVYKSV